MELLDLATFAAGTGGRQILRPLPDAPPRRRTGSSPRGVGGRQTAIGVPARAAGMQANRTATGV